MTKPKNPVKKTNLKTDKKVKVKPLKLSSRGLMKQKLDMSLDDLFAELVTKKPRKTTKKASTKKTTKKAPAKAKVEQEPTSEKFMACACLAAADCCPSDYVTVPVAPVVPKLSLMGKVKRWVKRVLRLGR